MNPPTQKMVAYLTELLVETRRPANHVARYDTFDKANSAIRELERIRDRAIPIKAATRAAVFCMLKETEWTKEDMYVGAGIETLSRRSDGTGATEHDAKRCIMFLEGKLVKREPKPAQPEAELLGELADWIRANTDEPEMPKSVPEPIPVAAPAPVVVAAPVAVKPRRVISRPLPPTLRAPRVPFKMGRIVPRGPRRIVYSRGYLDTFGHPDEQR